MKKTDKTTETIHITAPNLHTAEFQIVGTAPYVQNAFPEKARQQMMEKMMAGSQANKKKAKAAKDFDDDFFQSQHISTEGWNGIPASAFRNSMISACRLVGFKMTIAKMSVFIIGDGFDSKEFVPLVKIVGTPEKMLSHVRLAPSGVCDIHARARFWPWSAIVRVQYDADQFSAQDVTNLLAKAGGQTGIGEGRPDSKSSAGMGWGTFKLA